MAKFNFFKPWTWFSSKERNTRKQEETPKIEYTFGVTPPYRNIYFTGSSIVVVLQDGEVIMKEGVNSALVEQIKIAPTVQAIRNLLTTQTPVKEKDTECVAETAEERKIVTDNLAILRGHSDFVIKDKDTNVKYFEPKVFLTDVSLELPAVIVGSFIELLERMDSLNVEDPSDGECEDYQELEKQYEALKMFWYWTALNPIESSRRDLFNFVRKNDITITANGLLMMYRRIVRVEGSKSNNTLAEFISNSYLRVKKWKKAAKNYKIYGNGAVFQLVQKGKKVKKSWKNEGNLLKLYKGLDKIQVDKTYTDNHTGTKDIKIGTIYKEDEDKIDLDNTKDCSQGLHVGSKSFGFGGFGNVGVLCLVNPMYVRSVPKSETNKMRVSEMFIVGEMDLKEYSDDIENQVVADFSDEYCSTTVETLKKALKDKTFEPLTCQGKVPDIGGLPSLDKIVSHIKERIEEVV